MLKSLFSRVVLLRRFSGRFFPSEDWPGWLRYSLAVALVALALVGQAAFVHYGATGVHYLTFYAAVILAAVSLGYGPGFVSVALSATAATYWIARVGRLSTSFPGEIVGVGLFVTISLVLVRLCESHRRAGRRALAAEMSLSDSHQKVINTLLDGVSDGFVALDRDWRYTIINRAASDILGTAPEELMGRVLWDVFPEADGRLFGKELRRSMDDGVEVRFEEYYPEPLNMWVEIRGYPTPDSLNVFFLDVTKRHLSEEALQRQAQLLDLSGEAIFVWEFGGSIEYWNAAAAQLYGYVRDEALGRVSQELLATTQPRGAAPFLAELEREGHWRGELIHRTKDGRTLTVETNMRLIRQEGRRLVLEITRDLTARKRIEDALRESEERFRTMADFIPQLAWVARPDGYILWYNRQWHEYTGTTAEQMEGWGWQSVHDPAVLPSVLERWKASIATGEPFDMEFPLRGADGRYRPFLTRATPMRNSEGRLIQWFGTNTEITSRKQMEEALAAANHAKDRFLATLSHELRTPLTPVLAAIEMFEQGELTHNETDFRETMSMIRRNLVLEARLIDDLLDLTRIANGKINLEKRRVDLCEIIKRAEEVCQPDIVARRMHFGVDADDCPHWIDGDPVRLQQVLWNLLRNAIKFTHAEGCVGIRCRRENGEVVVDVMDSGIGIEAQSLERIFDAFEQEHQGAKAFGGLGLGLAISKKLVELHGGRIAAFSDGKNHGARFRLPLPTGGEPIHQGQEPAVQPATLRQLWSWPGTSPLIC